MSGKNNSTSKPHEVGAKVAIIRTEHGWHDGAISGVVKSRYQRATGSWGYVVVITEEYGHERVPPYEEEIENTSDMLSNRNGG